MTSETPIVAYSRHNVTWEPVFSTGAGVGHLHNQPPGSTTVIGIRKAAVAGLISAFDAWYEAGHVTPVDTEFICHSQPALCKAIDMHPEPTFLGFRPHAAPSTNPAIDLREWLSPDIAIASLAAACGVSERGFYGWLAGGGIRERNARRLHQVRSITHALMRVFGRDGAIEWLLTPQKRLALATPLDALAADRQTEVLALVSAAATRSAPPAAGPMIAEDLTEDFSSYDLALSQAGPQYKPRKRRRRRVGEASVDEAAR
jgi:hypothetical protein